MNFQQTVLLVAGIFLVVMFIIIIVSFLLVNKKSKYPPIVGECPDFWEMQIDPTDNKPKCINPHRLGNITTTGCDGSKDFNTIDFSGIDGNCRKATWARNCNLSWDGLTNNSNVCSL